MADMTEKEKKLARETRISNPFGTSDDFEEIPIERARDEFPEFQHACHGLFYALDPDRHLWGRKEVEIKARVLIQFRFDGSFGFPGGLLDKGPESLVEALNRELVEEIHLDVNKVCFHDDDHMVSHVNKKKRLVTHFYTKKLTLDLYDQVEKATLDAQEWGVETQGIVRVPLYSMHDGYRGLPLFLANRFAGNARSQMLLSLKKLGILSEEEILSAYNKYLEIIKKDH